MGESIAELQGHGGYVVSVAFSPDGTRLATGSDGTRVYTGSQDNTARIWDLETGDPLAVLQGHESTVWSVAFSPDGTRLATGSYDKTARIWDLESGEPLAMLQGHEGRCQVRGVLAGRDTPRHRGWRV